jgi:3-methylcrotonyl-CoA carboxylase alpha subunit
LSENEGFALACDKAGVAFVGPPAGAIAAMGSKAQAKSLMAQAGVPLVPGYHGENQDPDYLRKQADAIGYPVLIKASAGGGGKGMRVVEASLDFEAALASCQRESRASFGDDRVLIERYLQKPRHIEIQVFADMHGHCIYLFERDCSIQRRHQKVIEEAPAPAMTASMRQAMGEAAVAAAQAVNYVGAGTVEFIVEPSGHFYFMEMNTRLQVEHPVTEMITGLDLVEWQLRVAAGELLPLTQEQLQLTGHAIEARIYAENTEKGFLPSIGRLTHVEWPSHVAFSHGEVRLDAGVRGGDEISPYYDPMIAKLIVWGSTREQARLRMQQALSQTQIVGVHTNVDFLSRVMDDDAFASADLDTGFIERRRSALLPERILASDFELACAVAAVVSEEFAGCDSDSPQAGHANDPWGLLDGWRLNGDYCRHFLWLDAETPRKVSLFIAGRSQFLEIDSRRHEVSWQIQRTRTGANHIVLSLMDRHQKATVIKQGARVDIFTQGKHVVLSMQDPLKQFASGETHPASGLNAPMPGKIIALHVKAGQQVKKGDALIVMEAMKMEHVVFAPSEGVVKEVFFGLGEQVSEGLPLIELI